MIKIHDFKGQEYTFTHSKFPDGTSQAWLINPEPQINTMYRVTWMFENETEFVIILQLGALLKKLTLLAPTLNVPFFPYSRQDKIVSNNSTFAKNIFMDTIKLYYGMIKTYDVHSSSPGVNSYSPVELINAALPGHDVVCFPDAGAGLRYNKLMDVECVVCDKIRNQLTGEIEGLKFLELNGHVDLTGCNVLVVDDLCDGGKTFTEVAKLLKSAGATNLSLAVSHGLFTKGLDILYESGYNHIYTTNSTFKMQVEDSWIVKRSNLTIVKVV